MEKKLNPMKSILIVSATPPELDWLRSRYGEKGLGNIQVNFLITGVGMINTAFSLGEYLGTFHVDMAIQVGIAGSFSEEYPVGSVVEVSEESLPEMGAESPEGFLKMEELGFSLLEAGEKTYYNTLPNDSRYLDHLPWVTGITVNRVSGTSETIAQRNLSWNPGIETMEGAAFFLAMKQKAIPFMEVRGISNKVEPRNRSSWRIKEALEASQLEVWAWLKNNSGKMEE